MDDRETVAAVAAGDPAGLAGAYDEYAGSVYGYCHWMLGDPDDASDSVQDTFVIAASRLGGLGDSRKLRPWLYAVARNECQLRLDGTEPGLGETDDLGDPQAGPYASTGTAVDQAELREFVRSALDGLNPAEREVLELDLRHDLRGADLAAVLGVPRNQAHHLATQARGRLEHALGALLVARTGRRPCPGLDMLLDGWDGELAPPDRKQIDRHVDQCDICADRVDQMLWPAVEQGMVPPPGLRDEVLQLCTSASPGALSYRREVTERAGPFRPNGFPEPVRPPRRRRRRILALSGMTAAVAGVVIAIAATGIVALALTGGHPPASSAASAKSGQASQTPGAATSAALPGSPGPSGGAPIDAQPGVSATATASSSAAPPAPASSPPRSRAHLSPSHTVTPEPPPTPSRRPTFTFSPPPPTPTISLSSPGTGPAGATPGG